MHRRILSPRLALLAAPLLAASWAPPRAHANERHMTYTYESAVLPQGAKELEVWTTNRYGRHDHYSAFDQRLEFEVGLTDRLQTSLYLNASALNETVVDAAGVQTRAQSFQWNGISSEWKYKLLDPVADAVGMAVYGELTYAPTFAEIEARFIVDKRIGNVLLGANLVAEHEWIWTGPKTERELELEADAAAVYFLSHNVAAGIEGRSHNEFEDGGEELEAAALFAGPVVSYATESWWVAASFLPQLYAPKHEGTGHRDLDHHEKWNARLLFSFHLP
jgi:hypothetical protein